MLLLVQTIVLLIIQFVTYTIIMFVCVYNGTHLIVSNFRDNAIDIEYYLSISIFTKSVSRMFLIIEAINAV